VIDGDTLARFLADAAFTIEAQYGGWSREPLDPASRESITVARVKSPQAPTRDMQSCLNPSSADQGAAGLFAARPARSGFDVFDLVVRYREGGEEDAHMVTVRERQSVRASEEERRALVELGRLVDTDSDGLVVTRTDGGERVEVPRVIIRLLRDAIHHLTRGDAITLVPLSERLTTQEAAEILNVSRPHLVKLLERGEIPFERITSHRRIKAEDLLAYKQRRDAERREHIAELARITEQLCLYDAVVRPEDLEE
jgi:excisionase family DNA binding protein